MAEISRPWAGTTVGDAGPYTAPNWWDVWQAMVGGNGAIGGVGNKSVFLGIGDALAVTYPGPNFLSVGIGAALLDGLFYHNDAAKSVTVTSATSGKVRDDRLVVRKYFSSSSQTARIVLVPGSEAVSPGPGTPPALTQDLTRTTYWDIPLARVSITDGGVITLTDEREFIVPSSAGMVLLEEHVVPNPSTESYFNFAGIPQQFADLIITYQAGTSEIISYGGFGLRINDDTDDNHYSWDVKFYLLETAGFSYGKTYGESGVDHMMGLGGACRGDDYVLGKVVSGEIHLIDYSSSNSHHGWGKSFMHTSEHAEYEAWYRPDTPAPIRTVRVVLDNNGVNKFMPGSTFRLYATTR